MPRLTKVEKLEAEVRDLKHRLESAEYCAQRSHERADHLERRCNELYGQVTLMVDAVRLMVKHDNGAIR